MYASKSVKLGGRTKWSDLSELQLIDPRPKTTDSYLKQFWKIVIMFCTHIYQKTSVNTIILGNAHVTKPSYLKQLT